MNSFFSHHALLAALALSVRPSDFIAPANGTFFHVDANATTRGVAWEPDFSTPAAYPPDGRGAYAVPGRASDGTKVFLVQAATIRLRALTGYGTGGTMRYTIRNARTNAIVHQEDVSQIGADNGDGASRTNTFPYADYMVTLERLNGVVATSGLDIRNY